MIKNHEELSEMQNYNAISGRIFKNDTKFSPGRNFFNRKSVNFKQPAFVLE
jgi:hypothetical protein